MKVRQLTATRRDVRDFVAFPFRLYAGSAEWCPPLASSVELALDRQRHPFYRHSDGAFFVVEQAGEVVGRIGVFDNQAYNTYRRSKVAFFYYFDVIDDAEASRALLDAAAEWARARGLDLLMGPKGMLRSDAYGILVEGYEYPAPMGVPYNYPYYATLIEAAGFEKELDYLTGFIVKDDELPERVFRLAAKIKERSGFSVQSFRSKRELRAWIPEIQRVNNEAFTQVWGYYPIDDAEVQMIGDQLITVSDPRLLKVVTKDGAVAGFAFVFPDLAEALRATRGRLWPLGWIRFLIEMKRTRRLVGNGVGLLPQYQGLGATAMLYAELNDTIRSRGADYLELIQVMDSNIKSLGDMNALGVTWHKRHRVYRRCLQDCAPSDAVSGCSPGADGHA